MIDSHNNIRKQGSSENKKLIWNSDLAQYAKSYAQTLADNNSCNLEHLFEGHDASDKRVGENLAMYRGSTDIDNSID